MDVELSTLKPFTASMLKISSEVSATLCSDQLKSDQGVTPLVPQLGPGSHQHALLFEVVCAGITGFMQVKVPVKFQRHPREEEKGKVAAEGESDPREFSVFGTKALLDVVATLQDGDRVRVDTWTSERVVFSVGSKDGMSMRKLTLAQVNPVSRDLLNVADMKISWSPFSLSGSHFTGIVNNWHRFGFANACIDLRRFQPLNVGPTRFRLVLAAVDWCAQVSGDSTTWFYEASAAGGVATPVKTKPSDDDAAPPAVFSTAAYRLEDMKNTLGQWTCKTDDTTLLVQHADSDLVGFAVVMATYRGAVVVAAVAPVVDG